MNAQNSRCLGSFERFLTVGTLANISKDYYIVCVISKAQGSTNERVFGGTFVTYVCELKRIDAQKKAISRSGIPGKGTPASHSAQI